MVLLLSQMKPLNRNNWLLPTNISLSQFLSIFWFSDEETYRKTTFTFRTLHSNSPNFTFQPFTSCFSGATRVSFKSLVVMETNIKLNQQLQKESLLDLLVVRETRLFPFHLEDLDHQVTLFVHLFPSLLFVQESHQRRLHHPFLTPLYLPEIRRRLISFISGFTAPNLQTTVSFASWRARVTRWSLLNNLFAFTASKNGFYDENSTDRTVTVLKNQ